MKEKFGSFSLCFLSLSTCTSYFKIIHIDEEYHEIQYEAKIIPYQITRRESYDFLGTDTQKILYSRFRFRSIEYFQH